MKDQSIIGMNIHSSKVILATWNIIEILWGLHEDHDIIFLRSKVHCQYHSKIGHENDFY